DPARTALDDQDVPFGPHHFGALPEDQLHEARVLAEPTGELHRPFAGLDVVELHDPALGLRDDLLRHDEDVLAGQRRAAAGHRPGDELTQGVAGLDLGEALDRDELDPPAHSRAPRATSPSCRSAAAVIGARSGSAASTAAIAERSSGVSTSSASESSASTATSCPARSARSLCRPKLPGPNAGPIASAGAIRSALVPVPWRSGTTDTRPAC